MRSFKIIILLCCLLSGTNLYAQTAAEIEADLGKTLDKIYQENRRTAADTVEIDIDLLAKANADLEKKLVYYGKHSPGAIPQVFKKLGGISSDDGLLNIFSWDTNMGGTDHLFENVVLYKPAGQTSFSADSLMKKGGRVYAYDSLYTITIGNKNYYLTTYYGIFDLYMRGEGIRVLSIENGALIKKALIKTASRITDHLYFAYNQDKNNEDIMGDSLIEYNPKNQTITFPVINAEGNQTENYITYKFNGQYFVKEK